MRRTVAAWVIRAFSRFPWSEVGDFCLNCGEFVLTKGSHCIGLHREHVVVRRVR